METLADEEALKAIEESREEVARGEYVECSVDDLESFEVGCLIKLGFQG